MQLEMHAVLQERKEKQFFGGMSVPETILQAVLHTYNNVAILGPHDRLVCVGLQGRPLGPAATRERGA